MCRRSGRRKFSRAVSILAVPGRRSREGGRAVGDAENPVATECAATGAGRYGRKCFKMSGRRLAARMPLGNRKEGMQVMLRVSYSDTAKVPALALGGSMGRRAALVLATCSRAHAAGA